MHFMAHNFLETKLLQPQMSTTPPGLPPLVPTAGLGLPDITPAQAAQESGPLKYLLTRQQQIKGNAEFLKGT